MSSTLQYLVTRNAAMHHAQQLDGRLLLQGMLRLNAIPVTQIP